MSDPTNPSAKLIRIRGGRVLTCDADDTIFDPGEVWIEDRRVTAVGPEGATKPPGTAEPVRTIETPGRIVMPGLINAHCHSYTSLLKGTTDGVPLDIYMLYVIAAGAGRTAREVAVSTLIDSIAMIRTGTTAIIDHFSHRPAVTEEALDAVAGAFAESGLRAAIAPMFADLPYLDTVPLDKGLLPQDVIDAYARRPSLDPKLYFEVMEWALGRFSLPDGRIKLLLGVDGPQRYSPQLLEMTGDFQRRHRLGLHTHMLETKTQAVMADGAGFVRRLIDLGILDDLSSLVHFIWCTEDDIASAREAGVTIVNSPRSNLRSSAGICPVLKLRRAGLPMALGTDGSNSCVPNMFELTRLACLLARVTEAEFEEWLSARDVFEMALTGGARAMGRPGELGVITAGALADVIVLNPESHLYRPMGDVWSHLAYYENGSGVETVIIDGEVVLEDGRILTLDEDAILAEAEEIVARHRGLRQNAEAEVARLYPAFHDMVVSTLSRQDPLDRLIRFESRGNK